MRFFKINRSILCLLGSLVFFAFACTNEPKSESEPVTPDANADAAAVGDESTDAAAGDETANAAASATDDLSNDADKPAVPEATPPAPLLPPVPVPEPVPVAIQPVETDSAQRVVRYVLVDQTPAYSLADETSRQVNLYMAGDPLVVKLIGDWAELRDSYFIKSSALSAKLVPRVRRDPWASQPSRSAQPAAESTLQAPVQQ
jgi:hypothetical protein